MQKIGRYLLILVSALGIAGFLLFTSVSSNATGNTPAKIAESPTKIDFFTPTIGTDGTIKKTTASKNLSN